MARSSDFHRLVHGRRQASRWSIGWGEARLVVLGGMLAGLVAAVMPWPVVPALDTAVPIPAATISTATATIHFGTCHSGGGTNCVVDGDTFWMHGEKIRIADIDTPETHPPKCAEEARLGDAATARLRALLNAGPVTLESADRDSDRYGRKLRIVTRDGESLGGVLVDEGLARWYRGGRRSWC